MRNIKKNYYFDMDGVLVKYDRDAYIGEHPIFLQKNMHYFKNLEPDMKMLSVIDGIWSYIRCHGLQDEIYIITNVSNKGTIFNEHFHDKLEWIQKWIPYFPISHVFISVTSKRDICELITNREVTRTDILIDDFNRNLFEWYHAGGIAVKYLNGINSPESWLHENLQMNQTAEQIINYLIHLK